MTTRTPTGETPFKLAFGTEVVIFVEIGLSSLRGDHYDENLNNKELKISLDCLDEVRYDVAQRMA